MDPTYSRDECITAIRDFYSFLGKMYLDLSAAVIYPPATGWPNLTTESMACLGKYREILALLRQLPYPEPRPFWHNPNAGLPGCRLYDWKTNVDEMINGDADAEKVLWDVECERHYFGKRIPGHVVGLMETFRERNVVLLDVKTGLVYWMDCPQYILEACEPQPSCLVYPLEGDVEAKGMENAGIVSKRERDQDEDDTWDSEMEQGDGETPPTSDDEEDDDDEEEIDIVEDQDNDDDDDYNDDDDGSDDDEDSDEEYDDIKWGPCWPVRHFFAMLKNHYLKLNFIPYDEHTVIHIWAKEYENWESLPKGVPEALQSIYRKHGWPDVEKFNKEECLAEMKREVTQKIPNSHLWRIAR